MKYKWSEVFEVTCHPLIYPRLPYIESIWTWYRLMLCSFGLIRSNMYIMSFKKWRELCLIIISWCMCSAYRPLNNSFMGATEIIPLSENKLFIHNKWLLWFCAGVHLVGGNVSYEGRVEIFYNGEWGTVCGFGFDGTDADVVCRELGYPGATKHLCCAAYGQGSGSIWLDEVACNGKEVSLYNCSHNGLGVHSCSHYEDVGVICTMLGMPSPGTCY